MHCPLLDCGRKTRVTTTLVYKEGKLQGTDKFKKHKGEISSLIQNHIIRYRKCTAGHKSKSIEVYSLQT